MKFGDIFGVFILLCIWILLMESVSPVSLVSGLIFSMATLWFCNSTLPLGKIRNVNFFKLIFFPLFLIGQVYLAGFYIAKVIFLGGEVEVVDIESKLTNESLLNVLADSITLTPGSTVIQAHGNQLKVLWLKNHRDANIPQAEKGDAIKGSMENWLLKAEKKAEKKQTE